MYKKSNTVNVVIADFQNERLMDTFSRLQNGNPLIRVLAICRSGEDLIDRVSTMSDVDAVLMDFNLMDMTAIEVARELKEVSLGTDVFAISNSMSAEFVFNAKNNGIVELFKWDGLVHREVADTIVKYVTNKRLEYEQLASEHGAIERGTKNTKIVTEYITNTLSQSVILTYNMKGGVGKSTVATNLAVAIKLSPYYSGKRVALVDFDCGGANISTLCSIPDMERVTKNLVSWEYIDPHMTSPEEVDSLLIKGPHGIMVAPAPLNLKKAREVTYELADKILSIMKKYFDVIVIDGAPNLNPIIDAALEHATKILLIANPEGQSINQLAKFSYMLNDLTDSGQKDCTHILNKMFIVANNAQKPTEWDIKPSEISRSINRPLLREIPNSDTVKQALHGNSMKQAIEIQPDSDFSIAIKKIANDLCGAYPEGVGKEQVKNSKKKVKGSKDGKSGKKIFGLFR